MLPSTGLARGYYDLSRDLADLTLDHPGSTWVQ
jgi:hypothetical protein